MTSALVLHQFAIVDIGWTESGGLQMFVDRRPLVLVVSEVLLILFFVVLSTLLLLQLNSKLIGSVLLGLDFTLQLSLI